MSDGWDLDIKQWEHIKQYESGLKRSENAGRTRWDLVYDGPMLERWAKHLTAGAPKFGARNWMNAGPEDADRFRESAARHFAQWMAGEDDEDHAAAVFYNMNGYEYVKDLD